MKRPFPRFEVLGLTAALALAGACTPDNAVKPGAPVLTRSPSSKTGRRYGHDTSPPSPRHRLSVRAATSEGGACDPAAYPVCADGDQQHSLPLHREPAHARRRTPRPPPARRGSCRRRRPTGIRRLRRRCLRRQRDQRRGRRRGVSPAGRDLELLLRPDRGGPLHLRSPARHGAFRPNDAGNQSNAGDAARRSTPTPPSPVSLLGGLRLERLGEPGHLPASTASAPGGPSLSSPGRPTFPTSSTVTITLNKTKVLAKDGRTPFTGDDAAPRRGDVVEPAHRRGNSFVTQALSVAVATPPPPPKAADAGADAAAPVDVVPDMTAATATFNNIVCPQLADGTFDATAIGSTSPPPRRRRQAVQTCRSRSISGDRRPQRHHHAAHHLAGELDHHHLRRRHRRRHPRRHARRVMTTAPFTTSAM